MIIIIVDRFLKKSEVNTLYYNNNSRITNIPATSNGFL